ncbi:MAG: hypothetical protein J5706_04570 [Elusimicrobiales bacterium]|nr:hypothetical protein [Elusimicrobiales bacterium]
MNLTEHFTFEELTKTDITDLQAKNRRQAETLKGKLIRLAEWAETIRSALGNVTMIITSGYRCRCLNSKVGGACGSQHVKAEAIDFRPQGIEPEAAFRKLAESRAVSFGQLILEKRGGRPFIHIGMGSRRQLLYSPKAGVYEAWKE